MKGSIIMADQNIPVPEVPKGIQATLADYFKDTEYFSIQDANELVLEHQNRDVNTESIRARIYEGINKGLFERVGKGLYTVTRKNEQGQEATCLVMNGNGRDLSMFKDNSLDAIITDHPYNLEKSLKGGNRNFADYEKFLYTEEDFKEKQRVLKPGAFLVEFLPEENGDNYEYLYQVKQYAKKAGLEYYAKVPWQKTGFVANTGRKSKFTEDICFFSKGKARNLRPDAKKNKAYDETHSVVEFKEYIPASTTVRYSDMGGMPYSNETKSSAIDVHIQISVLNEDRERAKALIEEAWDNALLDWYANSPLNKDYGGKYTWDELDEMPLQDYILKYIEIKGLDFRDVSHGPVEHFMSGANGMLPTAFTFEEDENDIDLPDAFSIAPPGKKERIHQAEKPVELMEQILKFITLEEEVVLDQFAGSGVLGEAALNLNRNCILIESNEEMYQKIINRLTALEDIYVGENKAQIAVWTALDVAKIMQEAHDNPTDKSGVAEFFKNDALMSIDETIKELEKMELENPEDNIAVKEAASELKNLVETPEKNIQVLECSSMGDKRFSGIYAKLNIHGKEMSIEEIYQNSRRDEHGKKAGKGKPCTQIIDPYSGCTLPASEEQWLYRGLWIAYFKQHPELVEYASQFQTFTDYFSKDASHISPAEIVEAYIANPVRYTEVVQASKWYQKMSSTLRNKQNSINDIISNAHKRSTDTENKEVKQLSLELQI